MNELMDNPDRDEDELDEEEPVEELAELRLCFRIMPDEVLRSSPTYVIGVSFQV